MYSLLIVGSAPSVLRLLSILKTYLTHSLPEAIELPCDLPCAFSFKNKYGDGQIRLIANDFKSFFGLTKRKHSVCIMIFQERKQLGYLGYINSVDCQLRCLLASPRFNSSDFEMINQVALQGQSISETIIEDLQRILTQKSFPEYKSGLMSEKEGILRVVQLLTQTILLDCKPIKQQQQPVKYITLQKQDQISDEQPPDLSKEDEQQERAKEMELQSEMVEQIRAARQMCQSLAGEERLRLAQQTINQLFKNL